MMEYINSALRNEYGISINLNKTKKEFKINYKVISPLLFNFEACESLGIDPRKLIVLKPFDERAPIVEPQCEAYAIQVGESQENKASHVDEEAMVQNYFDLYFTITNDVNDYVLASVILKFALSFDVSLKQLKKNCVSKFGISREKNSG